MIELRPSTLSDYQHICGKNPPLRFRGLTVFRDDEPCAIAGLSPSKGAMQGFSAIKPGVTYSPRLAMKIALEIVDWMRTQCSLVYIFVECDKNDKFHRWLGFKPRGEWKGYRMYQL